MSTKERILEKLEQLDEGQLEALEQELKGIEPLSKAEKIRLWKILAEPISKEDQAEFNKAVKRLPWRTER